MTFRLSVNICISWDMFCVLARASHMAFNFACKMLWNPGNCYANLMLLIGTLAPTIFPLPLSSRGIKEPSLDML